MADEPEIIGEVTESSTMEFVSESRELHSPPPFGSFVKVSWNGQAPPEVSVPSDDEDPFMDSFRRVEGSFGPAYRSAVEGEPVPGLSPAIYAVVHQATTSPVDSGRRPRAYWKDEDQLNEEQPELSEWMLVTDFHAIIIGYSANGLIYQFLPPQPPKIHTFVHQCTPDEIRAITSKMDFLRTLANSRSAPSEEVVAACIREANAARGGDFEFLVEAGKELASLLKDDYDRLQAIMRRVAP
jgi:hypothetical protein